MANPLLGLLPRLPGIGTLSARQYDQLDAYADQLRHFNRSLNLISRDSVPEIESFHIPHSLSIMVRGFPSGAVLVDWGTGGGLPAIPLAIVRPDVQVHAVDVVEKKILAVRSMVRRLGLENVHAICVDAIEWPGRAHYSVSRAAAPLAALWRWHRRVAMPAEPTASDWHPGLICLKGGELGQEIGALQKVPDGQFAPFVEEVEIDAYFACASFRGKKIVHVREQQA